MSSSLLKTLLWFHAVLQILSMPHHQAFKCCCASLRQVPRPHLNTLQLGQFPPSLSPLDRCSSRSRTGVPSPHPCSCLRPPGSSELQLKAYPLCIPAQTALCPDCPSTSVAASLLLPHISLWFQSIHLPQFDCKHGRWKDQDFFFKKIIFFINFFGCTESSLMYTGFL